VITDGSIVPGQHQSVLSTQKFFKLNIRLLTVPVSVHRHLPGDGACHWIQHDAGQPDRHPPRSAFSSSDAND
jgi:hypothetical protein